LLAPAAYPEFATWFDISKQSAALPVPLRPHFPSPLAPASPVSGVRHVEPEGCVGASGTRNTLQHTATHCDAPPHTATLCNTMQHTAAHCDTLPHVQLEMGVGAGGTYARVEVGGQNGDSGRCVQRQIFLSCCCRMI